MILTADIERMRSVIDATVQTCRELGYEWELAVALQMRANILANRATWAGDATRDADEALELFTQLGTPGAPPRRCPHAVRPTSAGASSRSPPRTTRRP